MAPPAKETSQANRRQFSTPSIRFIADKLDDTVAPSAVDSFLTTLAQLDQQIHDDFKTVRAELSLARQDNARLSQALEHQRQQCEHVQADDDAKRGQIQSLTAQLSQLRAECDVAAATAQRNAAVAPAEGANGPSAATPVLAAVERLVKRPSSCDCRPEATDESPPCFFTSDHAPECALRRALLTDTSPQDLCDILIAREDAFRNQQVLIDRLKADNKELKSTYDDLWARYQLLYDDRRKKGPVAAQASVNDRIEHLSVRVQQAGMLACTIATKVEERLKLTARDVSNFRKSLSHSSSTVLSPDATRITSLTLSLRSNAPTNTTQTFPQPEDAPTPPTRSRRDLRAIPDEYDNDPTVSEFDFTYRPDRMSKVRESGEDEGYARVTDELMRTMALQLDAHEKLRSTVLELTSELGRIDPDAITDTSSCKQQLQASEKRLDDVMKKIKKKDHEILDLRRQLTKVIAEYEAISVAHSYSNAELSKIRANNREKTKLDRQGNDHRMYARGHNVLDGVENRHHRKIHFR